MIKMALSFVAGLAVGGGITYYIVKKKFDKDVQDLMDYYKNIDKYRRVEHEEEKSYDEAEERPPVMSKEERDEMRRIQRENRELDKEKVNYSGMYKAKDGYTENCLSEGEYPKEDDEEPEDDAVISPEQQAHEEHQRDRNKAPRIISAEDAADLGSYYDHQVLYFYALDETLATEDGEVLDNVEYFVGDALTKYNFIDNDEKEIFVVNYAMVTCYEISKVNGAYDDAY